MLMRFSECIIQTDESRKKYAVSEKKMYLCNS